MTSHFEATATATAQSSPANKRAPVLSTALAGLLSAVGRRLADGVLALMRAVRGVSPGRTRGLKGPYFEIMNPVYRVGEVRHQYFQIPTSEVAFAQVSVFFTFNY